MERSFIALFITILALPGTSENASAGPLNDLPHFSTDSSGHSLAGEWLPAGGISGCNGQINATLVAPSGLVYIGGRFTLCGDVVVNRVAAYDPATDTFQALGSGLALDDIYDFTYNEARSFAIFDGQIYVGGSFQKVGDVFADNIARWDGERWHAVGAEGLGYGGSSSGVNALAASENCLYAGGGFSRIGGISAYRIACWDGEAWHALADEQDYAIGHLYLRAIGSLAVSGNDLYVGGRFSHIGYALSNNVARWDGEQWHALGAGVDEAVSALAVSGNDLYVAGRSSEAGDEAPSRFAHWDGEQWRTLENADFEGRLSAVSVLAVSGNRVYAGGRFDVAGGIPANGIAYWDGIDWHAVGTEESNGVSGQVRTLSVANGEIYVGGIFNQAGSKPAANIARLSEARWYALPERAGAGANGWRVTAFAASEDYLYVGGDFDMIGGLAANNIARWDGQSWSALESNGFNGVDDNVQAIVVVGDRIYVGGYFDKAGGKPANYIAYWDGSDWGTLGEGYDNGVNDDVQALAVFENELYVGGVFDKAWGLDYAGSLVRWDGEAFRWPGDDEDKAISGPGRSVSALAVAGGNLYAAGRFSSVGDVTVRSIARWDGSNWFALGDGDAAGVWSENPDIRGGSIAELAASGNNLYAAGLFTNAGDVASVGVARWDGVEWHALDTGWDYEVPDFWDELSNLPRAFSLAASGDKVYLGGKFSSVGDTRARNIAHWDGNRWSSLDLGRRNGVDGSDFQLIPVGVAALTVQGGSVYVGGNFIEAGGETSFRIAEFVENPDFRIEPGHTALWHSPERSGEGWVLEVLDPDTALFYWFTFDEHGNQRWIMDVGSIDGNRIVFEEMHYTHGGRLGHTDPDAVERPLAGQAVMTFTDCGSGAIEFEAFDQHHVINFKRLTWSSGMPCGDFTEPSADPRAALTGTWYDPAHSGEGFVLQWMANGEALVIWFTYDNEGNQQWIIGTGRPDGEEVVFSDLHVARGARFGGDFDPGDVEREEWGELRLTLNCESGVARWESVHPEYADGQLNIEPLTRPDGLNCR